MAQMKEHIKTPEKDLSDKEIGNPSDAEFKTLVIRVFTEMIELSRKMKATQSEIKQNVQGTNSEGKETLSGAEGRKKYSTRTEWGSKNLKNEKRLRNLWDNLKHPNVWIIWVLEEQEQQQEIENLFEQIMKENFPNLEKEIYMKIQKSQRIPKKLDQRRNTPTHIIIKLPSIKGKERILKAVWEEESSTYKGVPIRLSADFSKETLLERRVWKGVFQVIKGKDLRPRCLYPAKLSFRVEG